MSGPSITEGSVSSKAAGGNRDRSEVDDMKPVVSAYDDVADGYSRALDPEGAGLVDPVLTGLIGEVGGQEVLSLACGQGQDARLLARLGADVPGVDVSEEMLRRAREREAAEPRGVSYARSPAPCRVRQRAGGR